MKIIFVFLVGSMLCGTLHAQHQFPSFDKIAEDFYANYSVASLTNAEELRFEKRPEGWMIAVWSYDAETHYTKQELYWDSKTDTYATLGFPEVSYVGENNERLAQLKFSYGYESFCYSPFFGYNGWDWDVITHYKDAKNLSDTLTYFVGKAFSSYAKNLLNNNSGFAIPEHIFKLSTDGKNALSPEQVAKFKEYALKGIDYYQKVHVMNPGYQTIVGDIFTKLSNEYVDIYLTLCMFQNEAEAAACLPDKLYSDFFIAAAKNYLTSCPPKAILFTSGDSDTYPLLYVQKKKGFRTDVLVVNTSLLNTARYINHLRDSFLGAEGLPLSFTREQIADGKFHYVYFVEAAAGQAMPLGDFVSKLKDSANILPQGYCVINSKRFSVETKGDPIVWDMTSNYILKSHIVFYDILLTNNWQRPLCFVNSGEGTFAEGFDEYMYRQGMAYLMHTKKNYYKISSYAIKTDQFYENLMKNFDWSGIAVIGPTERRMCTNYRFAFGDLAAALIKLDRRDSALKVLDYGMKIITPQAVPVNYGLLSTVEAYLELNQPDKAYVLAEAIINSMYIDDPYFRPELRKKVEDYIDRMFEQHNKEDLRKKIQLFLLQKELEDRKIKKN